MIFAIFTLVQHIEDQDKYYGYAPYVREMDIWNSQFDEVIVVAPLAKSKEIDDITIPYAHSKISLVKMPVFDVKSFSGIIKLLFNLPRIILLMIRVMRRAHHLHFRCPSNISAVASVIQIFFPKKKKTMRYAGNWDPNSRQPFGYRFQKAIFKNPIFSKNMTALVYGKWPNETSNMQSFFAATFHEKDKIEHIERDYSNQLNFVFVGALVPGKQPLLAIKIIEGLIRSNLNCQLEIFGDGELKPVLDKYIFENQLGDIVRLRGNVSKNEIKLNLQQSHFNILPSKSEGWPKSIAEGMFFGVIPISTKVSCVDWMLGHGKRGILISEDVNNAILQIIEVIQTKDLMAMSREAQKWSQQYTVEKQTQEIKNILRK